MRRRIKVTKEILDLFPECRPSVGEVFDADCSEYEFTKGKIRTVAVIDFANKKIILRSDEFEIVGG